MTSEKNVMHKLCSLEQLALHEIAKKTCNILFLQDNSLHKAISPSFQKKLLKVLPGALPTEFPKLWKDKLLDSALTIGHGCYEASDWTFSHKLIIQESGPLSRLNKLYYNENTLEETCEYLLSNKGKYEAIRFINPFGHFDNISWVKLFVDDENQSLKLRFYLACFYCLEDKIKNLWSALKVKCQGLLWDNVTPSFSLQAANLIEIWVYHLEGIIVNHFYIDGFKRAYQDCQEHAAKFFWNHCSADERTEILSSIEFDSLIFIRDDNCVGFLHFIYSLLSVELKKSLMSYVIDIDTGKCIWVRMLRSYYYESVLNDILTFPDTIPFNFYALILDELAYPLIAESTLSRHKKVFKTLWNHLTQDERNQVLDINANIILYLFCTEDADLLGTIILPLPRSIKEIILLNHFHEILDNLDGLIYSDKYEACSCSLLLFFLDYEESGSRKLALRSDADYLLERFIRETYTSWMTRTYFLKHFNGETQTSYITTASDQELMMENFKETLPVVDELLNKMDYTAFPLDFLSKKIYPLFSRKINLMNKGENPDD